MKLYKKQIRPMIVPPCLHGMNNAPYPYKDEWYDEELKDELKKTIQIEDSWARLDFDERYIEINEVKEI